MSSGMSVIVKVRPQHPPKTRLVQDDHMIQTFSAEFGSWTNMQLTISRNLRFSYRPNPLLKNWTG